MDLAHGVVSVRHACDQDRRELKQTKTGNKGIRRFAIEPALMPLLRAMHDESDGIGCVVQLPDRKHWAETVREHLKLAGVTELLDNDDTNKHFRFHDLRSTGLTWMALRGDEHLKIQHRAGHRTFGMTQVYIRTAENLRASGEAIGRGQAERSATRATIGRAILRGCVGEGGQPAITQRRHRYARWPTTATRTDHQRVRVAARPATVIHRLGNASQARVRR